MKQKKENDFSIVCNVKNVELDSIEFLCMYMYMKMPTKSELEETDKATYITYITYIYNAREQINNNVVYDVWR